MPTINQLIKQGRVTAREKSKYVFRLLLLLLKSLTQLYVRSQEFVLQTSKKVPCIFQVKDTTFKSTAQFSFVAAE